MMLRAFLILFPSLFAILACSDSKNQAGEPSIATLSEQGLADLISNRNGQVLFLNVWATWCAPCKEEFPDLVKLVNHYRGQAIEIVGLSVDYPDEIESKIKPFLKEVRGNFPIYVKDMANDENLINTLNPEWSGALPATLIYDAAGQRRHFILGKHEFSYFKKQIDPLLKGE